MKSILESSIYLIIMALICLFSIDFVSMNMSVSKIGETEQYIEDYIELYGENRENNTLDETTVSAINEKLKGTGMIFAYEYMSSTESHAYYNIHLTYNIRSRVFKFQKKHTFDGLARVDI